MSAVTSFGAAAPGGSYQVPLYRRPRDLVVVDNRFAVADASRTRAALLGVKGLGSLFHRRLLKRANQHRLDVEAQVIGGAASPRLFPVQRPLARLIGAIAPARAPVGDPEPW